MFLGVVVALFLMFATVNVENWVPVVVAIILGLVPGGILYKIGIGLPGRVRPEQHALKHPEVMAKVTRGWRLDSPYVGEEDKWDD